MRRAANVDANAPEIVAAFRAAGALVVDLSRVGGGVPDLLVVHAGRTLLVEVKNPKRKRVADKLTPAQVQLHAQVAAAGARVHVVESAAEAIALLGARP